VIVRIYCKISLSLYLPSIARQTDSESAARIVKLFSIWFCSRLEEESFIQWPIFWDTALLSSFVGLASRLSCWLPFT
jgi:hypothetical protein